MGTMILNSKHARKGECVFGCCRPYNPTSARAIRRQRRAIKRSERNAWRAELKGSRS